MKLSFVSGSSFYMLLMFMLHAFCVSLRLVSCVWYNCFTVLDSKLCSKLFRNDCQQTYTVEDYRLHVTWSIYKQLILMQVCLKHIRTQ